MPDPNHPDELHAEKSRAEIKRQKSELSSNIGAVAGYVSGYVTKKIHADDVDTLGRYPQYDRRSSKPALGVTYLDDIWLPALRKAVPIAASLKYLQAKHGLSEDEAWVNVGEVLLKRIAIIPLYGYNYPLVRHRREYLMSQLTEVPQWVWDRCRLEQLELLCYQSRIWNDKSDDAKAVRLEEMARREEVLIKRERVRKIRERQKGKTTIGPFRPNRGSQLRHG